ncbi:hypothetical protein Tco_0805904 [Tanacetum coccineum]
MTHPHPKGNFVPKAVLMKSGIKSLNTVGQNFSKAAVSVNTARPINTAYPRPTVNNARKASNVLNKAHTHVRRPFNKSTTNKNSNLKEKVNTFKGDVTTAGLKAVVRDPKGGRITGKGQDGKKIVPDQKYILLLLLTSDPSLSKSSKDSLDVGFKPLGEEEKIDSEHQENEDSEVPNTEEPKVNQEQDVMQISTSLTILILLV